MCTCPFKNTNCSTVIDYSAQSFVVVIVIKFYSVSLFLSFPHSFPLFPLSSLFPFSLPLFLHFFLQQEQLIWKSSSSCSVKFVWHQGTTYSVQFSSVAQSCPTLCDPMNHSTPGFPVHHQFLELIQIHVPRVGDAIQPSHPLSSPSSPAPNPSQHQGLFK